MDEVVLVDMMDRETGREEKITAHEKACFIGHFRYFCFMGIPCCYRKEHPQSTTAADFGQTHAVLIHGQEKK